MITINIYYSGENGNAKKFAKEMIDRKIVEEIRKENGNIRYDYFFPFDDDNTVLLIDAWKDQEALDRHHSSNLMGIIAKLREKYNLHMKVEKYESIIDSKDEKYIRK